MFARRLFALRLFAESLWDGGSNEAPPVLTPLRAYWFGRKPAVFVPEDA